MFPLTISSHFINIFVSDIHLCPIGGRKYQLSLASLFKEASKNEDANIAIGDFDGYFAL